MKHQDFIILLESYYGNYQNDVQKQLVLEYLQRNIKEQELKEIFELIVIKYSTKYSQPPLIIDIQDILAESKATILLEKLATISNRYNLLLEDVIGQITIEMMGGWANFSEYYFAKPLSCRKNFTELYKKNVGLTATRKILKGWCALDYNEPIDNTTTKIIGNIDYDKFIAENNEATKLIEKGAI